MAKVSRMNTNTSGQSSENNDKFPSKFDKLLFLLDENRNAKQIIDSIRFIKPLPDFIEVSDFSAEIGRNNVVRVLKDELPKTGLGYFKTGRRRKPSRFIWNPADRPRVEQEFP